MVTRRAYITPEVLAWARERAVVDIDAAGHKVDKSPEKYEAWERPGAWDDGVTPPTMRQAEALADLFLVPLGTLFRESPPDWPDPIPEMRRLPGSNHRPSSELVRQIRLAYDRRATAIGLLADMEEAPPPFRLEASLSEPYLAVAMRLRAALGISVDTQVQWPGPHDALNGWRAAVETHGVLVFQIPFVDVEDMRGFAIAEKPLPIVGFTAADAVTSRSFTLLHELVHLTLGESTLENGTLSVLREDSDVERFCNLVAAEILLPRDAVLATDLVRKYGSDAFWDPMDVQRVARRFKVSDAVMLRQLQTLGRIETETFHSLRVRFDRFVPGDKPGGGNQYTNIIKRVGEPLLRLAFASAYQNRMTAHGLSKLVGLSVGNLGNLEERIRGSRFMFD